MIDFWGRCAELDSQCQRRSAEEVRGHPPWGDEGIKGARTAVMNLEKYPSVPEQLEESPVEKGEIVLGPARRCISARWKRSFKLAKTC
eukprot:8950936-Pyramimonas_sp.AAC.1